MKINSLIIRLSLNILEETEIVTLKTSAQKQAVTHFWIMVCFYSLLVFSDTICFILLKNYTESFKQNLFMNLQPLGVLL